MKPASLVSSAFVLGLTASSWSFAQAPAGSTGECKDGPYTTAESKRGACAGHGGVKSWFVTDKKSDKEKTEKTTKSSSKKTESESKSAASTPAPAPAPAAVPAAAPSKSTAAATSSPRTPPAPAAMAAPGGGAGKVWVNSSSKVYHCQGDEWYGKTKSGEYMSEAQAKSQGAHAAHGKGCS